MFGTITRRRYLPAIMGWYLGGKKPKGDIIDQEFVVVIRALAQKYSLHILSNANHEFVDASLRQTGLYGCFDQIIISSQSGARKPSEEAFRKLTEQGIVPKKSIFIDDRLANRRAAKRMGFSVLEFSNKQELIQQLNRL